MAWLHLPDGSRVAVLGAVADYVRGLEERLGDPDPDVVALVREIGKEQAPTLLEPSLAFVESILNWLPGGSHAKGCRSSIHADKARDESKCSCGRMRIYREAYAFRDLLRS